MAFLFWLLWVAKKGRRLAPQSSFTSRRSCNSWPGKSITANVHSCSTSRRTSGPSKHKLGLSCSLSSARSSSKSANHSLCFFRRTHSPADRHTLSLSLSRPIGQPVSWPANWLAATVVRPLNYILSPNTTSRPRATLRPILRAQSGRKWATIFHGCSLAICSSLSDNSCSKTRKEQCRFMDSHGSVGSLDVAPLKLDLRSSAHSKLARPQHSLIFISNRLLLLLLLLWRDCVYF